MVVPKISLTRKVEEYAKKQGCEIVGYYHGTSKITDDDAASKIVQQIGSKIHSRCEAATVDNKKTFETCLAGEFYCFSDKGQLVAKTGDVTFDKEPADVFSSLSQNIKDRVSVKLQDFDNHLDDISCDWRNLDLLK